jgi:hypothetical protein
VFIYWGWESSMNQTEETQTSEIAARRVKVRETVGAPSEAS